MSLNPKWVPMKWPCGPIAIARLSDANGGDVELRSAQQRGLGLRLWNC